MQTDMEKRKFSKEDKLKITEKIKNFMQFNLCRKKNFTTFTIIFFIFAKSIVKVNVLENKADINFVAAKQLMEKNLYPPSVHCSYYSCFQLLKFKMQDFFGITYEQLAIDISSDSKRNTHEYIISYITKELKKNICKQTGQDFGRAIKDLKFYRIKSDYEDIEINQPASKKAFELAEKIRNLIKENL